MRPQKQSYLINYRLPFVGKDATEAFEDVGHSDEARGLLKDMFVGDFESGAVRVVHLIPYLIPSLHHPSDRDGQGDLYSREEASCCRDSQLVCLPSLSVEKFSSDVFLISRRMSYFLPLTVLVGYFAWRFYTSGSA